MPLISADVRLSAACTAKIILDWIWDHFEKLKEGKNIVKRILEFTEYMQDELKKIELHAKDDCHDSRDDSNAGDKVRAETYIEDFLAHLKNAKSSLEAYESERNKKGATKEVTKCPPRGRVTVNSLLAIEDQLKLAIDKLQLLISIMSLKVTYESRGSVDHNAHLLSAELKASAIRENEVGLEYLPDPSIKCPSAPNELTIREDKNNFILSWKPCSDEIDKYELCYHESKNKICFIDKSKSSVKIGAPKVKPSPEDLVYTMKIRGVCGSIKGEWSNTVVGQFTKPLPQKPTLKKLFLRSTIAEITVTTPAAICATESPITCWQVAYIIDTGTEWSYEEFKMKTDDEIDQTLYIDNLEPKRRYTFKVKAMNAEGWSDFSYEISGSTNKLPSKTGKPSPPLIETLSSTTMKITVETPEGANFMVPVILWQVTAIYFDCSARREMIKKAIFKPNYTKDHSSFNLEDLAPKQQYNFKVIAKNERGWSKPSDTVIAFTGPPLPPTIRPSSFKSASLIKVRWDLPSKYTRPSYYEVCKKTKGNRGKESEVQCSVSGGKSSVIFMNLSESTTYSFKLRCWNGFYVSEWTEEMAVKTDHIPMRRKLSSKTKSPLTPKASSSDIEKHYYTLAVIEEVMTSKAAELSDQSDDDDPIII